jgi:endonuclease/exonuclease/phosphatase family metal-dependent hydrolase
MASNDAPDHVQRMLDRLGAALDASTIPKQRPDNLLIATWNVREFGGLTPRWEHRHGDKPARNLADAAAIATIVERFDVVAIQETARNLTALDAVMQWLGDWWSYVVTDAGLGHRAGGERLAFLFNRGRVKLSGLAGELVVPEKGLAGIDQDRLVEQFARSPYAVSFGVGDDGFTLVTLHVVYGGSAKDRTKELGAFANWLASRAVSGDAFDHNLIALGDFNIDYAHDANYQAFTAEHLEPPEELARPPRSVFDDPEKPHFYDQIAWFTTGRKRRLSLGYEHNAGTFDWVAAITGGRLDREQRRTWSFRISDHLPLWCEFLLSPDNQSARELPARGPEGRARPRGARRFARIDRERVQA